MSNKPTMKPTMNASRRAFLQRASSLSVAGVATPWALNLASLSEASAANATDYKATVCIFLYGGNDYANTVIPYDPTGYNAYFNLRPSLGYAQNVLTGTVLTALNTPVDRAGFSHQYALAPALAPLMPIFNAGKMAVILNVGTLLQPTTKLQYTNKSVPLPPKLFSHNDQQSVWQSSSAEGAKSGWGGKMGDLFQSSNTNSTFTCINVSGNAVYLSGNTAVQYQISTTGSVPLNGLKTPLFGSTACSSALASAPALKTVFPTQNNLGDQLKMVARMISIAATTGAKRQVFFVSMNGFDTHDGLVTIHPKLMSGLAEAMSAFYNATVELGVANNVTSFTASDFGRTLSGNNDGSDHGWGSMHFVMGGAVNGQRFYGTPPIIASNGPDDVGQGRLLPTTSVDQYAATLGNWLGVSDSDLLTLLPNLGNYNVSSRNLGFV